MDAFRRVCICEPVVIRLEFERVKTRLLNLNGFVHPKMLHFGRARTRQGTFLINDRGRITNLKMVTWEFVRKYDVLQALLKTIRK